MSIAYSIRKSSHPQWQGNGPYHPSWQLLNSLLRYSVVSIFGRLAIHPPAHSFLSCLPWWEVDTWLAILNVIVIDSKITDTAIYPYSDSIYSNVTTSYVGYLEAVQKHFNLPQCSLGGKIIIQRSYTLSRIALAFSSVSQRHRDLLYMNRSQWWVGSSLRHDNVLILSAEVPSPDGIRPCETTYPKPNVFYGLWVSLIVFDFGT